jgi:uncharacterized protein (TIGR02679 family)
VTERSEVTIEQSTEPVVPPPGTVPATVGGPVSNPAGPDLDRLRRLLGTSELAWLVARVRRRLEFGRDLDGVITHARPSSEERAAVARLLGRSPRTAQSLSVSLTALDEVLRSSGASPDGLAAAVVALTGPVTPRQATVDAEAAAWERAFAPLAEAVDAHPTDGLRAWYRDLRASGLVARLAGGSAAGAVPLLAGLAAVIARLPAEGVGLAAFAARALGDAHALDDDRPLATLTLGAARVLAGVDVGTGAQWRRETWAAVGLLKDELSTQVMTLGLPGDGETATGRALGALREAGQPAVLTLRQLVRDAPRPLPAGTVVFVCENPAVLATAADTLAAACPPLVCLSGQPSAATLSLLRLLARGEATLRYHGDFDWGGVRIAATLRARVGWQPWRYDTASYCDALDAHPDTAALSGRPMATDWDPPLAAAMTAAGRRVEEELVLDRLLADLANAAPTLAPAAAGGTSTGVTCRCESSPNTAGS